MARAAALPQAALDLAIFLLLALLASLLGAVAGGSLSAVIPTDALQLAASAGFLIIGIRLIVKSGQEEPLEADGSEGKASVDP